MTKKHELVAILTPAQARLLGDPRSPFSAEERLLAVMAYIVSGNKATEAVRLAGLEDRLSPELLRKWKCNAPWWDEAYAIAKARLQDELDAKYTRLIHKLSEEVDDRILHGNAQMTKDGDIVRVPVSLREAVTALGILSDKRAMIRGEPTSRSADQGLAVLDKVLDRLQSVGETKREALEGDYEVITYEESDTGRD